MTESKFQESYPLEDPRKRKWDSDGIEKDSKKTRRGGDCGVTQEIDCITFLSPEEQTILSKKRCIWFRGATVEDVKYKIKTLTEDYIEYKKQCGGLTPILDGFYSSELNELIDILTRKQAEKMMRMVFID